MEKVYLSYARLLIDTSLEGPFPEFVDFISDKGLVTRQRVKYEWLLLKHNHYKMFGHLETDCWKKKIGRQEWRPVTPTNQDPEKRPLQQPLNTEYATPRRTACTSPQTRTKIISAANSFQVLLENKLEN